MLRAQVAAEGRIAAQRVLDRRNVEWHADRARADDGAARIAHALVDRERDALVDRADEQHRDLLPVEPSGDDARIGGIGEVVERLCAAVRRVERGLGDVTLMLQVGDLAGQVRPLGIVDEALAGETDPDEDPDHESDENGRQRRDVVAEVEHREECKVPGPARSAL